jgi:Mn-dependent DtxR family transcriptional regulator
MKKESNHDNNAGVFELFDSTEKARLMIRHSSKINKLLAMVGYHEAEAQRLLKEVSHHMSALDRLK